MGQVEVLRVESKVPTSVILAMIIVAGLIPHLQVIAKGFFLADDLFILAIARQNSFWELFNFYIDFLFIRPLGLILWKLEYVSFGFNPSAFHLVSVALNCLNACLLYFCVSRLSKDRLTGFFSALLFVLFPLSADAVSWLAAQYDLMCTCFFLVALICFIDYVNKGKRSFLFGAQLSFILVFLTKETAVVLPFVLLVLDGIYAGMDGLKKRVKAHLSFMGLLCFYFTYRYAALGGIGGYINPDGSSKHLIAQPIVYLKNLFWYLPFNLLSPVSSYYIYNGYQGWLFLSMLFFLLILLWSVRKSLYGYGLPVFSIAFIFLTCLPVLSILVAWGYLQSPRYLYLPSAGYCIILSLLIVGLIRKGAVCRLRFIPAVSLPILFGLLLFVNNTPFVEASELAKQAYSDVEKLFKRSPGDTLILIRSPKAYMGAPFLGVMFNGMGEFLSTPGKAVSLFYVEEEGFQKALKVLKDFDSRRPANKTCNDGDWRSLKKYPGEISYWFYPQAVDLNKGIITPETASLDIALLRWDEASHRLNLVESTFCKETEFR